MPTPARIAFVGAGNHSTESLYPNIAHIPEFDLVAVCDLEESRAKRAARVFGATECFTDLAAMLDTVQPDGVCICGMPDMHHQVGLEVMARGIPVFMEKPPALTLAGAQELVDTAADRGTWGMVAFMKRFAPANVLVKEHLGSEAFGKLSTVTLIHGAGPYADPRAMLFFNAIHLIDLGRFFAGDVRSLFAYLADVGPLAKAFAVAFQFESGAVGQLNMNSGRSWVECSEEVYLSGEHAQVMIDASREAEVISAGGRFAEGPGLNLHSWSRRYFVSGNQSGWFSGGHYTRGYWGEMSHFARAVCGLVEPASTLADGLEAVRIIEAIELSATKGQPVALADVKA